MRILAVYKGESVCIVNVRADGYCDIVKTNFDERGTAFGTLELASKKDLTIVDNDLLFSDMLRYKASQKESELKSLAGASKEDLLKAMKVNVPSTEYVVVGKQD